MDQLAEDQQTQSAAVRRVVGIAALRKLRHMADEDQAESAAKQARARKLLTAILIVAAVGLGFLLKSSMFG